MRTKLNMQDPESFAFVKDRFIKEQHLSGMLLVICGTEYKAWAYDSYILDAIEIAAYWNDNDRTYDRIVHLRYWLRENIQHGHDLPINVRSLSGAHKLVDQIIQAEFAGSSTPEFIEMRDFYLAQNLEAFYPGRAAKAANKAALKNLATATSAIKKHFSS